MGLSKERGKKKFIQTEKSWDINDFRHSWI